MTKNRQEIKEDGAILGFLMVLINVLFTVLTSSQQPGIRILVRLGRRNRRYEEKERRCHGWIL